MKPSLLLIALTALLFSVGVGQTKFDSALTIKGTWGYKVKRLTREAYHTGHREKDIED